MKCYHAVRPEVACSVYRAHSVHVGIMDVLYHLHANDVIVDSVEEGDTQETQTHQSPVFMPVVRYLLALSRGGLCPLLRAAHTPIAQMRAVARGVRLQ